MKEKILGLCLAALGAILGLALATVLWQALNLVPAGAAYAKGINTICHVLAVPLVSYGGFAGILVSDRLMYGVWGTLLQPRPPKQQSE